MGMKMFSALDMAKQKSIINFPPKYRAYQIIKKHFKKALKKCLLLGSFYTLDEFYNWSTISELQAPFS